MAPIRRLVLDVLTPHDPPLVELARSAAAVDGVDGVNLQLVEIDREVQNVKLTVEGATVDYDGVTDVVDRHGGSVHSVDEVVCGEVVTEAGTAQGE